MPKLFPSLPALMRPHACLVSVVLLACTESGTESQSPNETTADASDATDTPNGAPSMADSHASNTEADPTPSSGPTSSAAQSSSGASPDPTPTADDQPASEPSEPQGGTTALGGADTSDDAPSSSVAESGEAPATTSETSSDPAPSATESGPGEPAGEPAVRFIGRFDTSEPSQPRFAWSGSAVVAAFEGTEVTITLDDSGTNFFTVWVDGELSTPLDAEAGQHDYPLATDLAPGPHSVELYRRTEASEGPTRFVGFDFGAEGALLAPPPAKTRRLEVIGDSITCGYGNEGPNTACPYTPDTENHSLSYSAVAARALAAELITIAWSGKGIVYNYDTDTNEPLPALYDRTLPNDPESTWDFSVQPDAVLINLGTNDFSTDDDPSPELFHERYTAFLEHLRSKYPSALILCTVGPMLSGDDLAAARRGIAAAVQARNDAGDAQVQAWELNIANDSPGCDWHPSIATHQAMADALVAKLTTELDW